MTFRCSTLLFWTCWLAILLAHLRLSYPAITCRGYPPPAPADLIALFIAPAFVGLPAVFGDALCRRRGVIFGAGGFAVIYALAYINLHDARPSTGHLAGIAGIIRYHPFDVIMMSGLLYLPALVAIYFLERVVGDVVRGALGLRAAGLNDCETTR